MYALVGRKAKSNRAICCGRCGERADDGRSQDAGDLSGTFAGRESERTGGFDGLHDSFAE